MQVRRVLSGRWPTASERTAWSEKLDGGEPPPLSDEHESEERHREARATVVSVVLLLMLAIGLFGAALISARGGDSRSPTVSGADRAVTSPRSPGATNAPADDRQALDGCRALYSLQRGVLDAARPAMRQWEVHIGAMNQLVAGKISLAQASAFWNSTRTQAAQRVRSFQSADRLFQSSTGSLCPESAAPPSTASPELRTCIEAVAAGEATVQAARATMVTWSHHVRDMEHLRMGTLSPRLAQQMWQMTWRQGDAELRLYRSENAKARQLSCPQ